MKATVCTLFDGTYRFHGRLMLRSLMACSGTDVAHVVVLALDQRAAVSARIEAVKGGWADRLEVMDLDALTRDFPTLPRLKAERPLPFFCFGLASMLSGYCLRDATTRFVVYADADLYWYQSIGALLREMGSASIGIVPHRFPLRYAHYEANGKFNVSAGLFRSDNIGKACAEAWAKACIDRCDASTCGDQKYLDSWPKNYGAACHVFKSKGIIPGPWNVWSYVLDYAPEWGIMVDGEPLVAMHFHECRRLRGDEDASLSGEIREGGFILTKGYPLRAQDIETLYRPYICEYVAAEWEELNPQDASNGRP